MSDILGEAVYSLLTSLEGAPPVYIAGQSPANAVAPFITYQRSGATAGRLTTGSQLGIRRIQVDVYAASPSAAEVLADQVEELMLGLESAGGPLATPLLGGFDRAEGTYRFTDYPEVLDDGSRIYRIILTFEQREQLAI